MNKILLFIICIFLLKLVPAQSDDYSWTALIGDAASYDSICNAYDDYILSTYPDSIPESVMPALKRYHRYNFFWNSKLGLVNNEASYMPYTKAAVNNMLNPICEGSDDADWELLGPSSFTEQFLGLVDEVLHDPLDASRILISCDRGGIWVKQDSGNAWRNVTDDLHLPGLCASEIIRNPFDHDHILASTATGILNSGDYGIGIIESFDNGESWSVMQGFPYQTAPFIRRIIVDPNDSISADGLTLYAISNDNGNDKIYTSTNTGISWSIFPGPPPDSLTNIRLNDIEIDDLGNIYLSSESRWSEIHGKIFKYESGQWTDYNINNRFGKFKRIRISKPDSGKIFILCDGYLNNEWKRRIFKTIDYGTSWSIIKEVNPSPGATGPSPQCEIEYSPESNLVYLGEIRLRVFEDDGIYADEYRLPLHVDIRDFNFLGVENGYEEVLIATDGGLTHAEVNLSDLSDIDLQNLNDNHLPIGDFVGIGIGNDNGVKIVGGTVHCHSWILENNTWDKFSWGDGGDCEVNWMDPDIYYYQANQSMYSSTNNLSAFYNLMYDWFIGMKFEIHPNDPYQVFFGRGKKQVIVGGDTSYKSHLMKYDEHNDLLTEIQVSENLCRVGPIAIANDNLFYVADFSTANSSITDRMMKTTNGGTLWSDLSLSTVFYKVGGNWVPFADLATTIAYKTISDIVLNPHNSNELWISITGVWTDSGEPDPGKFRVLRSTDGGNSWYDYSEGLPAFPVEALEYQTGSNNRIFAGTDVGVFYRDEAMNQWECFSNGLPVSVITDLDYESCSRTLYASTYGRAIFKSEVPFDLSLSTDTLAHQQNILWDNPKQIHSNIFIPSGTTLTVTADLFMDENTRIIVDRGAKLIVDDCSITNACDHLWQGIEVWGYADTSQYYSGVQGEVELYEVTISNAKLAIMAGKSDGNGAYIQGYEGGIIRAKDSDFINNNRSVAFGPYQNLHPVTGNEVDNYGRFERCSFKISSGSTSGHVDFEWFAYLASVKGIKFKGCYFGNLSGANEPEGIGIYSVFSSFYVTEICLDPSVSPCQQTLGSEFRYLRYGIQAFGIRSANTCLIEKSTFSSNFSGVYLSAMDNSAINQNYFASIISLDTSIHHPLLCGLYLDHCTGYQVEENSFYSVYSVSNMNYSVGITINNSGGADNLIYNNYCEHLYVGILAQNENRGNKGEFGLQLLCNDFQTCEYDIAVTADTSTNYPGIRYNQGTDGLNETDPANNIFSYTHNNPESDYFNGCADIIYWYAFNNGGYNLEPEYYSNPEVNPQTDETQIFVFSDSTGCPSSFTPGGGGGGIEDNRSAMDEADTKIDSTQNLLNLLVDGGDTEALNTEVETSFPDEAMQVRNELIASSPYLSDSVMVSTVEQENVLTEAMVTEVLMANPQSAKSGTVQQALDDRFDQLTEEQRTDIDQGWFVTGAKESLESSLAYYKALRQQALNNIIRIFSTDSLCTAPNDSIIAVLTAENSLQSHYELAFAYYAGGDHANVTATLNDIPVMFELSAGQTIQHQQFDNYMDLIIQLSNQGNSILDADSAQKALLYNILDNASGSLQAMARNVLVNIDTLQYSEPYILPSESLKEGVVRRVPVRKYYREDSFKLYPNPAGTYIIIEYTLQGEAPQGYVNIIDNRGIVVKTVVLTKNHDYMVIAIDDLPTGVYYCNFVINAASVQTEKLIISH